MYASVIENVRILLCARKPLSQGLLKEFMTGTRLLIICCVARSVRW